MRGRILNYDLQRSEGIISGDDGQRYTFAVGEWKGNVHPVAGQTVDFTTSGENAVQVYKLASENPFGGDKNKYVAALLAFFLGSFGVHKFYLGYNQAGIIMLGVTMGGILLTIILIGVFMIMGIAIIAFVECIIYLVTSDEDFQRKYVENQRPWF